MKQWLRRSLARVRRPGLQGPDSFLMRCRGVVHVGANTGQERDLYHGQGLRVVWIEPIPEVFRELETNLAHYPYQKAVRALVMDQDGMTCTLHVANNKGASSSVLPFAHHKDIWPDVRYERDIVLKGDTLPTVLRGHGIPLRHYDALVLDTQGTELAVLKGAREILHHFRYIKAEVPDFEAYAGCCRLEGLTSFLNAADYREYSRSVFAEHPGGGRYYDIVFERVRPFVRGT